MENVSVRTRAAAANLVSQYGPFVTCPTARQRFQFEALKVLGYDSLEREFKLKMLKARAAWSAFVLEFGHESTPFSDLVSEALACGVADGGDYMEDGRFEDYTEFLASWEANHFPTYDQFWANAAPIFPEAEPHRGVGSPYAPDYC